MKVEGVQVLEDQPASVPPRSRLYRLPLINPFSGFAESLTSHIARLAAAHCLPLWVLITREIAPLFKRKSIIDYPNGHCDLLGRLGAAVNGNNGTARETVEVIQRLTTHSSLRSLTMLTAGDRIAPTPLIRSTQAWCPDCLTDWTAGGHELYYPLLWNLSAVQVCPIHKTHLLDTCDHCHRTHHPLARNLRIGHCPRCGSWLGRSCSNGSYGADPVARPTSWQSFSAESAGNLISDLGSATVGGQKSSNYFVANLSSTIVQLFGSSRLAFARYVGVHHGSITDWLNGSQKPSLKALLVLGYRLGVSPSAFLLEPLGERKLTLDRPASDGDDAFLRPQLRRTESGKIEAALRAALKEPSWPPSSLRTICARGGFHQTQASKRFPELAKQVSEHYRVYRLEKRRQKEHFTKMLVRSVVYEVCWLGEYPSQKRVQAKLPRVISLRDPFAAAERRAVIRELGLDARAKPR